VRLLIAHGADIHALDSIGRSPLLIAITHNPRAIEPLLAAGVTLAEQTRFGPSLLAAARYQWLYPWAPPVSERENSVRILLGKGADPNTRDGAGRNALMVMSMERRLEDTTRRALRWGRPYQPAEAQTDKALQLIGEALLQAGCDLNAADQEGRTPLMYAVKYNRPTAVRLLLEKGANPMVKDKSGMIALDLAKQANHIEIVKLLLSKTPRAASALDAP
jgi:ankyrin repeat protein